jgi:hypothetical protein
VGNGIILVGSLIRFHPWVVIKTRKTFHKNTSRIHPFVLLLPSFPIAYLKKIIIMHPKNFLGAPPAILVDNEI